MRLKRASSKHGQRQDWCPPFETHRFAVLLRLVGLAAMRGEDYAPVISFNRPKKARLRLDEIVQSTGRDWKPSSKRSRLMR
jgi:hypothetical protein